MEAYSSDQEIDYKSEHAKTIFALSKQLNAAINEAREFGLTVLIETGLGLNVPIIIEIEDRFKYCDPIDGQNPIKK